MANEIGHALRAGIKQNTAAWGGKAIVLGANDGFEFRSHSMTPGTDFVMNGGITGNLFRSPGSPGNVRPSGGFEADLYYNDPLWRAIAGIFGLDTVTANNPGTGSHRHDLTLTSGDAGKVFTLAMLGAEGVMEFPTTKFSEMALTITNEGDGFRAALSLTAMPDDYRFNVGVADPDFVVVSVAAANGALTITAPALADFVFSPLTFTKVAGITAITVTIVAIDRFNNVYNKVVTTTDFVSEVWTDSEPVRRVVSATISGLTGAGNVEMGINNGVNNETNRASVTIPSTRDCILFNQLEVLASAQGGADFVVTTDEQCISELRFGIQLSMDDRGDTCRRGRRSEPVRGGGDWPVCTLGLNFSAFGSVNRQRLLDTISKAQLKVKVTATGPLIGATAFQHQLKLWFNGVQLLDGYPQASGPGVMPMDINAEAHSVSAVPTGFPASHSKAVMAQLFNGDSTAYLT